MHALQAKEFNSGPWFLDVIAWLLDLPKQSVRDIKHQA